VGGKQQSTEQGAAAATVCFCAHSFVSVFAVATAKVGPVFA